MSLADLVLSHAAEEEDWEDQELAKELAALQARRRAMLAATSEAGPTAEPAVSPVLQEEPQQPPEPHSKGPSKARSLAEELLAGGTRMSIEQELEAMDRELEAQLEEYRRCGEELAQHSSRPGTAAGLPAAPSEARSERSPSPPEGGTSEEAQELQRLKEIALRLEEAFPEPSEGELSSGSSPAREVRRRHRMPEPAPLPADGGPLDEEVVEMKSILEDLDVKLAALSMQQARLMAPPTDRDPDSSASRVINDLQAQNRHLRERLGLAGGSKVKGMLNLDRSLFPGALAARSAA